MSSSARTISPDEALERLRGHEENFGKLREHTRATDSQWDREIALLQHRVAEQFEQVDIGGGDTLAIRTCLSDEESERFISLLAESERKDATANERATATYQILALITANPLMTEDWFRDNRANYATMDLMGVLVGFLESRAIQQRERVKRVKDIASFRPV